ISLALWAALTAALGLVSSGDVTQATELKVLASVALTSVLDQLTPVYEKATGDKLTIGYSLAADLKKRILDGEIADVIILTRPRSSPPDPSSTRTPRKEAQAASISPAFSIISE